MSAVFDLFLRAVQERKQVSCIYHGYRREVCVHTLGHTYMGNEQALTFQFAGESQRGLPPGGNWRCMDLRQVSQVELRDGEWHTRDRHTRPQSCVDRVVAEALF